MYSRNPIFGEIWEAKIFKTSTYLIIKLKLLYNNFITNVGRQYIALR